MPSAFLKQKQRRVSASARGNPSRLFLRFRWYHYSTDWIFAVARQVAEDDV